MRSKAFLVNLPPHACMHAQVKVLTKACQGFGTRQTSNKLVPKRVLVSLLTDN